MKDETPEFSPMQYRTCFFIVNIHNRKFSLFFLHVNVPIVKCTMRLLVKEQQLSSKSSQENEDISIHEFRTVWSYRFDWNLFAYLHNAIQTDWWINSKICNAFETVSQVQIYYMVTKNNSKLRDSLECIYCKLTYQSRLHCGDRLMQLTWTTCLWL